MDTSTLSAETTGISILLVGDSGTGKTTLLGDIPGIFVFDFDKGMLALSDKKVPYATFKELPKGSQIKPNPARGLYAYGTAWPAFVAKLNEIGTAIDKGKCDYKALGFDSLTTLSNIALNFVLSNANRDVPQIQDWGAQIRALELVIDQLTAWPLVKVMTAHVQRNENDITGNTEKLPLVTGKFAGKVSVYFDEVYYCESKKAAGGEYKYYLVTRPDAVTRQAKSRIKVPNEAPSKWSSIEPHLPWNRQN